MSDPENSCEAWLSGGCHCGAIRYAVKARARQIQHCHCSICRRTQGSLFATYAEVSRDAFVVCQGHAELATFVSSASVRRRFCPGCGCHLLLEDDRTPDAVWYTPTTLDAGYPGHLKTDEHHVFLNSRVSWFRLVEPRR
jgi:hypothetical protein